MNEVVDKLAEKIGLAADKITPVAETVVAEVTALGTAYIMFGSAMLVVALIGAASLVICSIKASRLITAHEDGDAPWIVGAVLGGVAMLFGFVSGLVHLTEGLKMWLRPTYTAIKSLL